MKIPKWATPSVYLFNGKLQIWLNPSWKEFSWFRWEILLDYNRWHARIGRVVICISERIEYEEDYF